MDRFEDVSVVASVDESPPPPRVSRRARRAFTVVVASVVLTGGLAGAAVGLADEKTEPARSASSSAGDGFKTGGYECKGKKRHMRSSGSSLRY